MKLLYSAPKKVAIENNLKTFQHSLIALKIFELAKYI